MIFSASKNRVTDLNERRNENEHIPPEGKPCNWKGCLIYIWREDLRRESDAIYINEGEMLGVLGVLGEPIFAKIVRKNRVNEETMNFSRT